MLDPPNPQGIHPDFFAFAPRDLRLDATANQVASVGERCVGESVRKTLLTNSVDDMKGEVVKRHFEPVEQTILGISNGLAVSICALYLKLPGIHGKHLTPSSLMESLPVADPIGGGLHFAILRWAPTARGGEGHADASATILSISARGIRTRPAIRILRIEPAARSLYKLDRPIPSTAQASATRNATGSSGQTRET